MVESSDAFMSLVSSVCFVSLDSDERMTNLEQAFDLGDMALIRQKHDDVVAGLDHGLRGDKEQFFAPVDSADRGPRGQWQLLRPLSYNR